MAACGQRVPIPAHSIISPLSENDLLCQKASHIHITTAVSHLDSATPLIQAELSVELSTRMDTFSLTTEIREVAQQLVDDRDNLLTENSYLKSVVAAQQLQLKRYEELLRLTQGDPPRMLSKPCDGYFIKTFLYDPAVDSHLAPVVKAWGDEDGTQRALALATLTLVRVMTSKERISALLLYSTILRGCYEEIQGGLLQKALNSANEALQIAVQMGDPYLIGKCHYHRGICFLHFDLLADAHWSFVLASNTE